PTPASRSRHPRPRGPSCQVRRSCSCSWRSLLLSLRCSVRARAGIDFHAVCVGLSLRPFVPRALGYLTVMLGQEGKQRLSKRPCAQAVSPVDPANLIGEVIYEQSLAHVSLPSLFKAARISRQIRSRLACVDSATRYP